MKLQRPPSYEDRVGSPVRVGGEKGMILPYTSGTEENPEGAEAPRLKLPW
jgi:hypothetical protein